MSTRVREHGRRAVLLVFLWLAAAGAAAGGPRVADVRAEVGIGGWVAPGKIAPLRVDLRVGAAFDGALQVDVPSEVRGAPPVVHLVPVRLPAGGRQQVTVEVIVRDPRRPIRLLLRDARGGRLRRDVPVDVRRVVDGVVVALTHEAAGLEFLFGANETRRPAYLTEEALPARWQAYEAVDLLIIRDLDPRALAPAQEQALVEWVAQGGRMLVVAPDRLALGEARWLRDLLPAAGTRAYGHGRVAVAADDLFAPARRSAGALRDHVTVLLRLPTPPSAARPVLADILPATRPLPGGTQAGLAALSVLYIATLRLVLPRVPTRRGGWIGLVVVVVVAAAAAYGVAAGARAAATSLVQLSVAEVLGSLPSARVTTYASVIAPYGGRFTVRVPAGAEARPLNGAGVTSDAGRGELSGAAAEGQVLFAVRQVVPLRFQAAWSPSGALVVDQHGTGIRRAVVYRRRQLYRLPPDATGTIVLDPAAWEPMDRPGTLGPDLAGRAMDALLRQLDRAGEATWLVAEIADERLGLRTARGGAGETVHLAVAEVH